MAGKKRQKGFRQYFSKPRKGFKTYGALKKWRWESCVQPSPDLVAPSENLTSSSAGHSLSFDNGFRGFNVPPTELTDMNNGTDKRPLRVLSLFDGISTGYFVLCDKLKLDIERYYSSEICPYAIKFQEEKFGEVITPIGSVCDLSSKRLDELGRIDVLLGGSPCTELSRVNPRRKGLMDPSSSGYLFFHFSRILHYLQKKAEERLDKFFWLFENTRNMDKKYCDIICSTLGCRPVMHNASTYVPMERARHFWGNLPNMEQIPAGIEVPPLQDFLMPGRTALVEIMPTLTTNSSAQRSGKHQTLPVLENGVPSLLLPTEEELLFGFPVHYTDCRGLSVTQRRKLLGKGWSVHVIETILRPLQENYRSTCWLELAKSYCRQCDN